MSIRSTLLAIACAAAMTAPVAAIAENRLALVIGNSAYRTASALPNPANDARAVTELLQSAKFEVTTAADLSQIDMRRVIVDFAETVKRKGPNTVAVVYYAGHGVQVGGENFLIPVDANIKSEAEVALYAIRFDDLMNALEAAPTKARIVILDACRNNPFAEMQKTVGRGLAMVNAPVGSVVAYSTSPGTEAEDGRGSNSPFTAAFIAAAKQPGVPVEQTFKAVRLAVHSETEGRQTPWEVLSLTNNFSFFPTGADPGPASSSPAAGSSIPAGPGQTPAATRVSLTAPDAKVNPERASDKPAVRSAYWKKMLRGLSPEQAYNLVVSEDDIDGYREFLVLYPKAPQLARVRAISDRRLEMVAWYTAVSANSVGAYRYFLGRYGSSDMAATAQTLMQRAATRALLASNDPAALGCNCSVVPTRRTDNTRPAPASQPTRNARRDAPAREVIVNEPAAPSIPIGIGIGIGGGGMGIGSPGRVSPGGGTGGRPQGGSHSPSGGTRR